LWREIRKAAETSGNGFLWREIRKEAERKGINIQA
jgi:hypothetical protein